ncbi:MAG: methyltransferase domain-containing protein [Sphingobacteriia bacterium]|nr:methyltransferase domain-containing protein [Sphingobacteriia bacterium]NCC40529.1 methyltransferase domain-containing protein [Gammaproteobacteria bacterium]
MKTLESYDCIPYESYAITETHPDALAVLGRLLGIETADPEHCRVLELGSASGGNLIPMAYHLPRGTFVGVELAAAQARRGQSLAAALGLTNLTLLHQDIRELDESLGPFDFILAHGVYSWVPESVKERILQICGRLLSSRGIAYVSYNTLPGWRQRGMLRDMLLLHCREATTPGARLERARDLLERLATGLNGDTRPETLALRREVEYLRSARASYLYHEYLEETNSPELFSDFMARAQRHGLAFLAETKLHTMFASTLGPGAEAALAGLDGQVMREQYLDFLRLRAFRQTLLVRAETRPCLEIDLERLEDFALYADLEPPSRPQSTRVKPEDYRTPDGASLRVEQPLTKLILAHLSACYPNAVPLTTALHAAAEQLTAAGRGRFAAAREDCLAELFNLYASQGIGLTMRTAHWSNQVESSPRATRLARAQAAAGEGHVASVRHRSLGLDPLAAWLLTGLDGTRDQAALRQALMAELSAEPALGAGLGLAPGASERALEALVDANLSRLLALFARAGLLSPDPV